MVILVWTLRLLSSMNNCFTVVGEINAAPTAAPAPVAPQAAGQPSNVIKMFDD